jgi:hypothetical protein
MPPSPSQATGTLKQDAGTAETARAATAWILSQRIGLAARRKFDSKQKKRKRQGFQIERMHD